MKRAWSEDAGVIGSATGSGSGDRLQLETPQAVVPTEDPLAVRLASRLNQGYVCRLTNDAGDAITLSFVPAGRGTRARGIGCFLLRVGSPGTPHLDTFDLAIDAAIAVIAAAGALAVRQHLDGCGPTPHP